MKKTLSWMRRYWVWILCAILLMGLGFNESFKATIRHHRLIKKARLEHASLIKQNEELQQKIQVLESQPKVYETLVRRELGYIRPGEKEIRILKSSNGNTP